ncbi:helix-turn-helix transcriptional regulator [Frankia sp. BMG5.23]|uniref:helix-turn-helix domain-containing protein n=1 Tax=Frankia sp. BMG5.23 TaxID=683305 RepID=UPI00046162EC|nr:helix-turn-helix transcriptional regulator [Frankia sp. BMG5.23]KDA42833.1 putative transcriptional regulator [Frankia sp. BMG5.23]KEZ34493.1 putative transcriptional regulator [Frankia sp. CeD]
MRRPNESAQVQSFGARLRQLRSERGLRQLDLVGDNISASYISLLEAGRRVPTDRVIHHLSEQLGCSPDDLRIPTEDTSLRSAAVQMKLARAALLVDAISEAESWYRRVRVEHQDNHEVSQEVEFGLARAAELAGRPAEAAERYQRCRPADADLSYPHQLGVALGLVRSLARCGDADGALIAADHALRQISEVGLAVSDVAVEVRAVLASVLCKRGDYASAQRPIAEALEIVPAIADHRALADTYWRAGMAAYETGRIGLSLELAGWITDADAHDYGHTLGMLRAVYGGLLLRQTPPDPEKAREMLELAVTDLDAAGTVAEAMHCRSDLIRALIMLDRWQDARTLADEALAHTATPPVERTRARLLRATALSLLGDLDGARADCVSVHMDLQAQPTGSQTSQLWSQLGEVLTQLGDTEGAIHAYRCAINGLSVDVPPTLLPSSPRRGGTRQSANGTPRRPLESGS